MNANGVHISMFWWLIIAVVGFLILRSILRAFAAPRYYGGAPGSPPAEAPPPGPGYGPGYGYGGFAGGGSFWSGLLGGLGGAWLGNELLRAKANMLRRKPVSFRPMPAMPGRADPDGAGGDLRRGRRRQRWRMVSAYGTPLRFSLGLHLRRTDRGRRGSLRR